MRQPIERKKFLANLQYETCEMETLKREFDKIHIFAIAQHQIFHFIKYVDSD